MALDYQPLYVPFAAGLDQEQDERIKSQPLLDICKDVEFDNAGGLRTRRPLVGISSDKAEGGTINDFRRIVDNGGELVAFTKEEVRSYSDKLQAWVSRGTHLAVATAEQSVFVNTTDQRIADRAELGDVVFYAWTETLATQTVGKVAAVDKATGAVIMGPVGYGTAGAVITAVRVKLVALSTRVLLFFKSTLGLNVVSFDPASPAAGLASGATNIGNIVEWDLSYDAVAVPGADVAVVAGTRQTTTSYSMATVTAALSIATATKARTADGPVAVSCPPTGTTVLVARGAASAIRTDLITISGFVDTAHVNLPVTIAGGTTINQIAACHRSVQNAGEYRCYVYWSADQATDFPTQNSADLAVRYNYVDTGGNVGSQAVLVAGMGVASRAFDRDGSIYVHVTHEGVSPLNTNTGGGVSAILSAELQNAYFLYRDDGYLCAKQVASAGGGFSGIDGHLPHVQALGADRFAWTAIERRRVPIVEKGSYVTYADRGPREVLIAFDSNEARRTCRIGHTLYVAGGEVKQYDGDQLTEVGFHLAPWYLNILQQSSTDGLADGSYFWRATYRWDNARGERDRSTSLMVVGLTVSGGPDRARITNGTPLRPTHKDGVAVELWRTPVNPAAEATLNLVTSPDPSNDTNPNLYLTNEDPTVPDAIAAFDDEMEDDVLATKEVFPESSADVLESLAPPAANILIANDTRIFLAGVAGDPDRVWYSRQRADSDVASFNDALTVLVPRSGGAITGLAFLTETLVAFRETAVYALPGDGFGNVGGADGSQNYGPARTLSTDLGAISQEAIATTPAGLVFKTRKGWYLLNRGLGLDYIGGPVRNYDSEHVVSVVVVEDQHQIRIVTESRTLVFDYRRNQWGEWTVSGVDACIWQGRWAVLNADELEVQADDYTGVDYGLDVETAWIKVGDPQGRAKVRNFLVLGAVASACRLRVRVSRDNITDGAGGWSYYDDKTKDQLVAGDTLQFRHGPSRKECEVIKIRLTALGAVSGSPTGEAVRLTGLTLEVGRQPGVTKRLPAAMKQ